MIRKLLKILAGLFSLLLLLAIAAGLFMLLHPVFGGKPNAESLSKIQRSAQFRNGEFANAVPTGVMTSVANGSTEADTDNSIWQYFFPPPGKHPGQPLPSKPFDARELGDGQLVWLGHSTVLMQLAGQIVLTDPVFFRASPLPGTVKPFAYRHPILIPHLPDIDVVVISHDHYDHLDYLAIQKMRSRVKRFIVPLGIKAHLTRWKIPVEQITELDWGETVEHNGLRFTATPARHFSGRSLNDRNRTLWASWVIDAQTHKLFFSGDSGYFDGFKTIGEQHGPFDMAFIENGAYNPRWAQIHMMPEQAVQASIDLKARVLFPIHWGKFDLAPHPWKEPAERVSAEANRRGVRLGTPLVGEIFSLKQPPQRSWWQAL